MIGIKPARFLFAPAIVMAAACAQIAGLDDPGDVPAAAPTATANTTDAPSADDRSANATDGSDSGTPDVANPGPCPNAIFCESFDDDAGLPAWTKTETGSGVSSLVTNPFVSAPRSLRATNAGTGTAQLSRIVPVDIGITCEMSVRLTAWSGEGYYFELSLDPANKGGYDDWHILLGKKNGEANYYAWTNAQSQFQDDYAGFNPPATNTWLRVAIDARLRGGTTGIVVRVDGAEVASRSAPQMPTSKTFLLSIGLGTDQSSTADDVYVDDVICKAL
jgi:hypothetical protein